MINRTVELAFSEEFVDVLSKAGVSLIDKRVSDALGYLSAWGVGGRAAKVRIVGDRRGELTAVYMDPKGDHVFTIGTVPDDSWTFSFHS